MKRLLLVMLCLCGQAAQALEPPGWQELEFEQTVLWVKAQARLSLVPPPTTSESGHWQLQAESSVASNSESVSLKFDLASDQVFSRNRLSQGKKNQRYKQYVYGEDLITRIRREQPGTESGENPGSWPVTSRRELAMPGLADGAVVSSPYLLLLFASKALESPAATRRIVVHTDLNFYEVTAKVAGAETLEIEATDGAIPAAGTHEVQLVQLQVQPLGKLAEKDDFSLLGLRREISIAFDSDSLLPLQLRGIAPRLGRTQLNLKRAQLRTDQP